MEIKSFSYFCNYDSTEYNQYKITEHEKMDFERNAFSDVGCR